MDGYGGSIIFKKCIILSVMICINSKISWKKLRILN